MKLVKCGKCGAQFDVAAMKAGSSFPCGKCRTAVSVPGDSAPATVALSPDQMKKALDEARSGAAAKGQPKLPPAMQARAKATSASAPTRAAGAAPASAPAQAQPASAPPVAVKAPPRAARTREPAGAPAKKSPAVMYAVIGGVVVIGAVAAVVMSGGEKPKESAPPKQLEVPKAAEAAKPVAKPKDPENFDDFLSMAVADQHNALVGRLVATGSDTTKLKQLHDWVTNPKVAANADAKAMQARVVEAALKADTNCEWARTANGDHRIREFLQSCRDECGLVFTMPDPPENAVIERLGTAEQKPWADATEWAKYQEVVKQVRDRNEKMAKNPRYVEAEKKRDWIRSGPEFKSVEMTWTFADPYVIFQEVKKDPVEDMRKTGKKDDLGKDILEPIPGTSNPSKVAQNKVWADKGKLFTKRDGIIFNELNRRFRELFADEFKLEPLETCGPDKKGRILTALVMWNRKSFDALLKETGNTVSPGIRAFYSPGQQKIFHYIGEESLQSLDEIPTEGGYCQKNSDQVTFHEGTHQLQHEYTAILAGKPLVDNTFVFDARDMKGRAMWFEEGIAEFMGAAECEADKTEFLEGTKWRHNRILLGRVVESRNERDDVEAWSIKEFLKATSNEDLHTIGDKLAKGRGDSMASHFYCRGWAFCHFLWYYDNGKYRPKFMKFLRDVLTKNWSIDRFAKDMGRPNVNDWGDVEMEFEWYWNQLLRRKVEKSKVTGKWSIPPTDAPEGTVDDDFREEWKNRKK